MHLKVCGLLAALIIPSILFADQVTLKNGDTITGVILKKDGGKLTVKSEFLGEVTMPWTAVTAIKSSEPVVVVLPNGKTITGPVNTEGKDLQVNTQAGAASSPLA